MGTVDILANAETAEILAKRGRAGGLPVQIQDSLVKKLACIQGKLEPKGKGFYGIDLGNGYRTIFTLNNQQQPVLVFAGDHRDYDALSVQISTSPDGVKARILSGKAEPVSLASRKLPDSIGQEDFIKAFREASGTGRAVSGPETGHAGSLARTFARHAGMTASAMKTGHRKSPASSSPQSAMTGPG